MTDRAMRALLAHVASHLDEDVGLRALSVKTKRSPFGLHRRFASAVGETPKGFVTRLRLERAASLLVASDAPVLHVALDVGFRSHEVFTRAFARRFGESPVAYRARARVRPEHAERHLATTRSVGPCVRLFRQREAQAHTEQERSESMSYEIVRTEMPEQPVLFVRRKVKSSEIASTLAEVLPSVFAYAQRVGVALAGPPFCRYATWGPLLTLEAGMPVASKTEGDGVIEAGVLGGGFVAKTTHAGTYERLVDAHAALQAWAEDRGLTARGGGWEVYVTDPGEKPNPSDWRTDVYLPVKAEDLRT
jgi:AraC family transcriptional regulator